MTASADKPKPTPLNMPRWRNIPQAPAGAPAHHGFSSTTPRRGSPHAITIVDTGVLICIGCRRQCIPHFCTHYQGRLHVAPSVAEEIRSQADVSAANRVGPLVHSAAATAKYSILDPRLASIDTEDDFDVIDFDDIHNQLLNLDGRTQNDTSVSRHAGEAMSIAIGKRYLQKGAQSVVFLTNDGGASQVARSRGLTPRHFGHVLNELVCAGRITSLEAFAHFTFANSVSSVPGVVCPRTAEDMGCFALDSICTRCDEIQDVFSG